MRYSVFLFLFLFGISNLYSQNYKNLVLEGGGIRGIAYIGALEQLDEEGILEDIERVSGTSAGAITATLLAVGYKPFEIKEIISEMKMQDFNDGEGIFIGGAMRMNDYYGWYKGEEIRDWIDELIVEKTSINNMTFSELNSYLKECPECKDLYIHATNLSLQRAEILCYENYPDMIISDAVRVSSSIPVYFTAAFMDKNGKVYLNPDDTEDLYVMSDGGFISNYPIKTFDSVIYNEVVADIGYNPETLGLRLEREEQIESDNQGDPALVEYEIDDIQDYIGAFYNLVLESLNRCEMDDCDWDRTVSIDTCGIGPKIRKMDDEEKIKLIDSGKISVVNFLE